MIFQQREMTIMPDPASVRTVLARRLSRLRFAWFLLGALFGVAVAYYLFSLIHHDSEFSKRLNMLRSYALLESKIVPLPRVSAPPAAATAAQTAPPVSMTPAASASTTASTAHPLAESPASPAPVTANVGRMLPASYTFVLHGGDTLSSLLSAKGVSQDEAAQVVQNLKQAFNGRHLVAGQSVDLHLDKNKDNPDEPIVSGLSVVVSPLKTVTLTRTDEDSFDVKEIKAPVFKDLARAGGEIHSSLYQTGMETGLPTQMLSEIIQAFSYDVDFQRDIREGDAIDVVYERMHTDKNVTTGYGKIIYASLRLGDDEYTVYRHVSPDGFAGYYNDKGESVKKALLKTPINGARITSGFGMRMHPLLGYSKMHKGIDFGASIGTPIYAAGDGIVEEAGRKGGYGNYVRVRHNATYATAYGHASRIARGVTPGAHVKQGQVIAYVGSTGFSTGPHLHYEILVNGSQINPAHVKFRTGQTLSGQEMVQFKRQMQDIKTALNTLPQKTQVASLQSKENQ